MSQEQQQSEFDGAREGDDSSASPVVQRSIAEALQEEEKQMNTMTPGLATMTPGLAGLATMTPGLAGLATMTPGLAGLATMTPGLAGQVFRVMVPSLAGPVAVDVVK